MKRIRDIARAVRSKNAGSFHLTFDIFFRDKESYDGVKKCGVFTPDSLARLYGQTPVKIVWFDQGLALKFSIRRERSVGNVGDTDVFGCQQYAHLLDVEVP